MSFENWKILKSDLEEKQKEYSEVAAWCNANGYHIKDDGTYYKVVKNPQQTEEEKTELMRTIRNLYLTKYVDPYVSNPLRWADMSEQEQQNIIDYRLYLLNIPEQPEFPNIEIKTFDEWINNILD